MARISTHEHGARGALVALIGLLAAGCSGGDTERPRAAERRGSGIVIETGGAGLAFEPPVLELGQVVPGGLLEGLASARNVGREPVTIQDYSAPCECTSARPELPRTLQPGESLRFPVRLDLGSLPRGGLRAVDDDEPEVLERRLSLWTRRGSSAELTLRADISEQLVVEPSVLDLRGGLRSEPAEGRIVVGPGRARPERPVTVRGVRPLDPGPNPDVEVLPAAGGAELLVRLPPLEEPGAREWRLALDTDAQEDPALLLVLADPVEPILLTPERIDVVAPPGQPLLTRVHLRRRDGAPLELLEASSTSGRILVRPLGLTEAGTQAVEVLAAVRPWPEETAGEVILQTDLPGVAGRLTVPVRVREQEPR